MTIIERIDAREIPPRLRHPLIFKTWNELPTGGAIVLTSDHDPVPLFFQFSTEYSGSFHWEYIQSGPLLWRVRIQKGDFADPGFTPPRKQIPPNCVVPQSIEFVEPVVLDTRPLFNKGKTPACEIDRAINTLIPGQRLILFIPFEPLPLYAKLRSQGFTHEATQLQDGTWRIAFSK